MLLSETMIYEFFKQAVSQFPLISTSQLRVLSPQVQVLRNQLNKWGKQDKVWKLRRGLFLLNPADHARFPSKEFVAGQLVSPSYISMEYALFHYGVIPEFVADLTCVTSKKTQRYQNKLGCFRYQHITPKAFTGFRVVKDERGFQYFFAELEKALVDFFYFNLKTFKNADPDIFEASYRMRPTIKLKPRKLKAYTALCQNSTLNQVVSDYLDYVGGTHA